MTSIDPRSAGLPSVTTDAEDATKAAQQMEAFFLRRMLAEVRPDGGMMDGGFAGATFREMLDGALADKMAEAGGLGLADVIERELSSTKPASRLVTAHVAGAGAATAPAAAGSALSAGRAMSAYRASAALGGAAGPSLAPAGAAAPSMGAGALGVMPLETETRLTSRFGKRTDPIEGDVRMHAGLDLAAPTGAPVHAIRGGVVVRSGEAGGYGKLVVVDHGGGLESRYGHLSRIDVTAGQQVAPGAALGAVGQSGRATGPHLHLEVRKDGAAIDPEKVIGPLNPGEARPNRSGGGR